MNPTSGVVGIGRGVPHEEAPTVEVGALPWAILMVEVVPVGGVMVAPEVIPGPPLQPE